MWYILLLIWFTELGCKMIGHTIRVLQKRSSLVRPIRLMVSESAHKVVRPKDIENKLKSALSTTFLRLKDVSSCNCGQKFEVGITRL